MNKGVDYYLNLKYSVLLRPLKEEDGGGWLAEIPELKGCISDGETPEEALENLHKAKFAWLKVAIKRDQVIPEPQMDEEDYSGKLTLRMPKFLHKELAITSEKQGVSLNQYILSLIALNHGKQSGKHQMIALNSQVVNHNFFFGHNINREKIKKADDLIREISPDAWSTHLPRRTKCTYPLYSNQDRPDASTHLARRRYDE